MRKRCGAPNQLPGIWLLLFVDPTRVLAHRPSPASVLNMAQGALLKFTPKPTCWLAAPLKVSTHSRAPFPVSRPLATVAAPAAPQGVPVQPDGRLLPANSAPTVGASSASPLALWPT